ncbi:MAG: hypothetical protein Q4F54_00185 [Coriobacteriia bacterium]|nr:hypothetical protein [Coriobacteriia bacterium]
MADLKGFGVLDDELLHRSKVAFETRFGAGDRHAIIEEAHCNNISCKREANDNQQPKLETEEQILREENVFAENDFPDLVAFETHVHKTGDEKRSTHNRRVREQQRQEYVIHYHSCVLHVIHMEERDHAHVEYFGEHDKNKRVKHKWAVIFKH